MKNIANKNTKFTHVPAAFHTVFELPEVEPWPDAVNPAALLDELEQNLLRYVFLPKWAAETIALWVLHTYAFPLRDVSTYLGVESPEKRCGKTTLLGVLSQLVNRPVVAANISSPALFRVIEETRPTLLIDEADILLSGNDEMRGILNSGYSRTSAFVVRVANQLTRFPLPPGPGGIELPNQGESPSELLPGNEASTDSSRRSKGSTGLSRRSETKTEETHGETRLARYSCWCPKVMAAIGGLPDTLADRCIVLRMQRKTALERCERLKELAAEPLRRQCARLVLDQTQRITGAVPEIPPDLNDRAADIWEPLFVLADIAGEGWPEKARRAAVGLTGLAQESSPIGTLLLDILVLFVEDSTDRLHSRTIVEELGNGEDRPWSEALKGKTMTQNWLARQLHPFGIRPKAMWIGEVAAKGYEKDDFREAFRRYIPHSEIEALRCPPRPGSEEELEETASEPTPESPAASESEQANGNGKPD